MVKAGFSQRRKNLANALTSVLGIAKNEVYSALRDLGISESVRMEALDMERLIALSLRLIREEN